MQKIDSFWDIYINALTRKNPFLFESVADKKKMLPFYLRIITIQKLVYKFFYFFSWKANGIIYAYLIQNGIIYKYSFFFIVIKKMLPFYLRVITIQKLYS